MRQFFFFFLFATILSGCGPDNNQSKSDSMDGVIVRVNDMVITHEKFNALIHRESRVDPEFSLTIEKKNEFLDYLIQKELLIHEASRLQIDSNEAFVEAIEKYWESTLIRTLIDGKTEEFKEKVLVTDNEVETYYQDNETVFDVSLSQVREKIRHFLEKEAVSVMLEEWIGQLKNSATITKNKEFISDSESVSK